jgi:hypothetical protein
MADISLLVIFTASDWFNVHGALIFNRFTGWLRCVVCFVNPVMLYHT